jgi:hypothetical protein
MQKTFIERKMSRTIQNDRIHIFRLYVFLAWRAQARKYCDKKTINILEEMPYECEAMNLFICAQADCVRA